MPRYPISLTAWILIPVLFAIFACRTSSSITHLIPEGYMGPVVIVFDDPNGKAPEQDKEGGIVYEIPSDGVLRLNTPAPKVGLYDIRHFYVRADGTRREIPRRGDTSKLQIFADVDGSTGDQEGRKPIHWMAYVLGVPNERDDWAQVRGEATSRAIGVPGVL